MPLGGSLFPYEVEYLWSYSLVTAVRFWDQNHVGDAFNLLLHFSQKPWYTVYEVRAVQFRPFVYDAMNRQVPVAIEPMTPQDAALTDREPCGRPPGPANIWPTKITKNTQPELEMS